MTARLPAYAAFARAAFHKMLAYRLRYYTGVFSYLIYVTTYTYLWRSVYGTVAPGGTLMGFRLDEMVTYVAVGWLARSFFFNNVDREIADLVAEGEIATALARPVSFQGMMAASAIGESLFRLLFFSAPIAVVLFLIYPISPPASALHAAAFGLSSLLAFAVFFHVNFLVGLLALRLKSIQGVMRAKHYLMEILSGLVLPLSFFPAWLGAVTRHLPFQAVAFVPASIYLGRFAGGALAVALLEQAAWAALLTLLSALAWRRAATRLTIQGG
jgi:ABC-2 type transport system permease protein